MNKETPGCRASCPPAAGADKNVCPTAPLLNSNDEAHMTIKIVPQANSKLVIAHANFHRLWGGQAEVVLALSQSLARRGHRLVIITPPGSELSVRAKDAGIETFTGCHFKKGFRPISFMSDLARLRSFLLKNQVRVYHCHGSQDHWIGALSAGAHTKIIRTRHNIYPVANHVFNRWLFRKRTAQVITIFGAQGRYFTETGLLKQDQLFTLHSPLPQEFVNPGNPARVIRHELKLAEEVALVGFAANFHADKAPLDFVAAAVRVSKAFPNVHFCMAGHGPLESDTRAQVQQAGLADRFHLLGFRKDILPVMASFDLLVLSSIAREASSTVLKQAGALGLPVVATDVGGTCEVVEHEKTGLIVQPGDVGGLADAIKSLLSDRKRAHEMGMAGKEKVLHEFTSDAIAERMEALYFRVLGIGDSLGAGAISGLCATGGLPTSGTH